jgi:hypothetical protein
VIRGSASRFPELLFSASYNSAGGGSYVRAANGGGNTFSWRCIQQNSNYSDLAWQVSTATGATGSTPTWGSASMTITPTGVSAANLTVNSGATFQGSISQSAGQTASLGVTSVQSLTSSGALSGVLSTAAQPNISSLGIMSSLTVSPGTITGVLATAGQPNVTSLGTLSALQVSGTSSLQGALMNNQFLNLRTSTDLNHGMRYAGITPFAGTAIDGPVLHGFAGGCVGATQGGESIALKWNNSRDILNQFNVRLFDGIGYAYGYKILAIVTRTGSWSITPPASVFGNSGLVNQLLPAGLSGGWDSTNGWYVAPLNGYYRTSCYVRHTDTAAAVGLRVILRTLPSTDTNVIRNADGTAWCAGDTGNRKTQSVTFLVSMAAGQALILSLNNNTAIQEAQMHVDMVSL